MTGRFRGMLWLLGVVIVPGFVAQSRAADGKVYTDKSGLKSLVEPFSPPPLADLERQAKWVDQPVLDGLDLLRSHLAKQPQPIPVTAALKLRNTNEKTNLQILASLGRLPTSDSEVNWNADIVRHLRRDVKSTNPILSSSVEEFDLYSLVGIGLFSFDWDMKPFAAKEVVKTWQSSSDGMFDRVILRDDLTWSDGAPFTAHDVAFSFRAIMNPDVPAIAQRSQAEELRWVEAYDDHTVVFFHKRPLATNQWNVNFLLIPKHIYEKTMLEDPSLSKSRRHIELENNPVCAGPYTIVSRSRGQEIVLERRDAYFEHGGKQVRDKPFFKQIRFKVIEDNNTARLALMSGAIDELELNPEQWVNQTNGNDFYAANTKVSGLEWVYYYFGWNLKNPLFQDRRVRQALAYAFNHEEMLQKLNHGLTEPCNGIFHPTSWMAPKKSPPPYKQDLDKAETLLQEAGWEDADGDGVLEKEINGQVKKFEFTINCSNVPDRVRICALLKQNLDQLGIVCNVKPLEGVTLQAAMDSRNYDAVFAGWGTGTDPDTSENLWNTAASETGRNYGSYSNRYVDGLYVLGKQVESASADRKKIWQEYKLGNVGIQPSASRPEIYAKIHELIYADQPYTFLFFKSSFYGFNKQLRGYKFSPRGPYHYSPGFFSIWRAAS